MKEGGDTDLSKGAYDRALEEPPIGAGIAKALRSVPSRLYQGAKSLFGGAPTEKDGSVTKTEKSVTVTPAKKRGGSVKC